MHGLRKPTERVEIMFKDPKCYVEYVPGKSFKEAFANDRIPLLSMTDFGAWITGLPGRFLMSGR